MQKLISKLSPVAKAVVPAAVALVVAVIQCLVQGQVDSVSITEAVSGLVLSVLTYLIPNATTP